MPILHAIVLGITQGLSEFLPISSSGHLILVPWLFGWDDFAGNPSLQKTFDVALHLGTLAGALAYFRRDLVTLARSGWLLVRRSPSPVAAVVGRGDGAHDARAGGDEGRMAWLLLLSALPAAVTGALLSEFIEERTGQIWLVATMLILFGLVLLWADRLVGHRTATELRSRDAIAMGVGQALALQPGVSRSGVTITVGRRLGFDRDAAARLSFLMSLPIIAGAVVFKGVEVLADGGVPADLRAPFAWGVATSAITGWVAVWATLRLVQTTSFLPFVVYRVAVGLAVLGLLASSVR